MSFQVLKQRKKLSDCILNQRISWKKVGSTSESSRATHRGFRAKVDEDHEPCLRETYSDVTLGKPQSLSAPTIRVLGVIWDSRTDSLHFDVTDIAEPTKRNLVSIIGRFYDPLGYLSPVIIRYKNLFQRLGSQHLQWDEVVPPTIRSEWETMVRDLHNSPLLQLPRSYLDVFPWDKCSYQLCGFCDASTTAYAAVVYLVISTRDDVYTRFVVAKTRVAPMQTLTIPRLELLSALLLSRLIITV